MLLLHNRHRVSVAALFCVTAMLGCATQQRSPPPRAVPPEILARESCNEHIDVSGPIVFPANLKSFPTQSAYAWFTYTLDGSGKPSNIVLIRSFPESLVERVVRDRLLATKFKTGVIVAECNWVADFQAIRRP